MAYADYEFYTTKYYGSAIPDSQSFNKEAERASDFLDIITFERLVDGLPDNERAQTKIKKAVCALADKLYGLELAEKQALSAAAGSITSGTGGATTGVITSKSSGSESISYASPSEIANGAKAWSTVYSAAGDERATNKLLYNTAKVYLMGVRDDSGVPLLYAGMG
jgi:hypothetical protein|nr:MAG TPA: Head Tail Connector Protein [Caudoviricetes sp.]